MIEGKIAQLEAEKAEVKKRFTLLLLGLLPRYDNCMSKWNL